MNNTIRFIGFAELSWRWHRLFLPPFVSPARRRSAKLDPSRPAQFHIEIAIESVLQPIEKAPGLANAAYTSASFVEYERDQVLRSGWSGLCFASDLAETGTVKPVEFTGLQLLSVRDKSKSINAFHNVCSHRGMQLVQEQMTVQDDLSCR